MSRVVNGTGGTAASTGYTAKTSTIQAVPNVPRPSRLQSRLRRHDVNAVAGTWAPYRWVVPITWQNGANYDAAELNQQWLTNMEEVQHTLAYMVEDFDFPDTGAPYYPFTYPLASNEAWMMTWPLLLFGSNNFSIAVRVPTEALLAGHVVYWDSGGNARADAYIASGGVYTLVQFADGDNNPPAMLVSDLIVVNGPTPGLIELGAQVNSLPAAVKMGTCLLGMRLS